MEPFNSVLTDSNFVVFFSNIWNWTILITYAIFLIIAIILVALDARERGYGLLGRVAWCVLVMFVFPIGLALYLLMVRKEFQRWKAD
jgi:hypothetical protein